MLDACTTAGLGSWNPATVRLAISVVIHSIAPRILAPEHPDGSFRGIAGQLEKQAG